MKILAFDTSTKFLSIACLEDETVRSSYHKEAGIRHSEIIIPTIKKMLQGLSWTIKDVELMCVGLGPGSFTGLRIAVAAAKGMAAVLDNKVIGVPSMDAIVVNIPKDEHPSLKLASPFLDARKGKVYTCIYDCSDTKIKRTTEYRLTTIDELLAGLTEEVLFFGDGVGKYRERLDASSMARYDDGIDWYPRADHIGRIGYKSSLNGTEDPAVIEPLYLHAKECNITRKRTT